MDGYSFWMDGAYSFDLEIGKRKTYILVFSYWYIAYKLQEECLLSHCNLYVQYPVHKICSWSGKILSFFGSGPVGRRDSDPGLFIVLGRTSL